MNFSRTTIHRFWPALGLALACASTALAHGPKDHSARLTLMGDQMELGVTLGPDLAAAALNHAGLAPAAVAELLASRGPSGHGPVSAAGSAALVGLRVGDQDLSPTRAIVMTDGLEYLFVLTFPRPIEGALSVHARYLEALEDAPSGSLEVVQDGVGRIALELLSRSRMTVDLTLPERTASPNLPAAEVTPGAEPRVTPPAPTLPDGAAPAVAPSGQRLIGGWAWGIGGCILAAFLLSRWLRRAKHNAAQ